MQFVIFVVAVLSGLSNPFQSATNAELNKRLGSPMWASIFVYLIGLGGLLLAQMFVRQGWPGGKFGEVPWWAWMGGLISLISTVVGLVVVQKLGSGTFTAASVTAALVTSVVLDHFGVVGLKQHTASPGRMAGCALLVGGLWLVAKF